MARKSARRRTMRSLRSRLVRKRQKVRKKRILRTKVRHHTHRRYAGVRGKGNPRGRRRHVRPNPSPTAKRKQYRVKPKSGQGLPPLSMSTYMSMF